MEKLFYFCLASLSVLDFVKTALVVPPTSPTRHQLISGIGIPLALKDEAITLGLVMKAQYYLVSSDAGKFHENSLDSF